MAHSRIGFDPELRADYRAALTTWKIGQVSGEEAKLEDYLLKFKTDSKEESEKKHQEDQDKMNKDAQTGMDYMMNQHNAKLEV